MAFQCEGEFHAGVDRLFRRVDPWLGLPFLIFLFLAFLLYVPIKQRGGFINFETYNYVAAHLNPREANLLAHFFNQHTLDDWGFQNRNLSYVIDYLDVQFLGWSLRHGIPHFLSAFHFAGVGVILFSLWALFRKAFGLDRAVSFLLCTLFLLTPALHVTASYQRSAKMGACLEIVVLAFYAFGLIQARPRSAFASVACWLAALFFSFFDFMSVAMCLYFWILSAAFVAAHERALMPVGERRRGTQRRIAGFFASLLAVNQLWGRLAVPAIHEHFYGNRYFFAHAEPARVAELFRHPLEWAVAVLGMFVDQVRFFAGDFPSGVAFVGTTAALWLSYELLRRRFGHARLALALLGVIVLPVLAIWALLRIGNGPIFHEEFRRLYYPLPFQVLIALGAGLLFASALQGASPGGLRRAKIFLWLAVLGSATSLSDQIYVVRSSYLSPAITIAPAIRAGLLQYVRHGNEEGVTDEVRKNDLYKVMKDYLDRG